VSDNVERRFETDMHTTTYKKGDKTDCGNYRSILPSSTTYKILYNILRFRLTPHLETTTG